jgi:glyoxylase-like metal-dependent hydrolase (beta-lactamase superfamily II)
MLMGAISCQTRLPNTVRIPENQLITLTDAAHEATPNIVLDVPADTLQKYIPTGKYNSAINAFFIRIDGKNILFDTGLGQKLVANLANIGVTPNDIDLIFLTHAHGDHIGGLLKDGKPVFPNAKVFINQLENDYWVKENNELYISVLKAYNERIIPFSLKYELKNPIIEGFDFITAIPAYGHTPGHTVYLATANDNYKVLIWGDLTHVMPLQMPLPKTSVSYDVNPHEAAQARIKIIDLAVNNHFPVAGMHIAQPAIGYVEHNGAGGYVFSGIE